MTKMPGRLPIETRIDVKRKDRCSIDGHVVKGPISENIPWILELISNEIQENDPPIIDLTLSEYVVQRKCSKCGHYYTPREK